MKQLSAFLKLPVVKSLLVLYVAFNIFTVCSVSTAKLSDVMLCSSLNGSKECDSDKSSFSSSASVLYCSAKVNNAPANTKVTFTWKHGDEVLGKADVETGSGVVYSNFNTNGALAPGSYSVIAKINTDNSDPVKKDFTITE